MSSSGSVFKSTTTKPSWSSVSSTVLGCTEPRILWYTDMLSKKNGIHTFENGSVLFLNETYFFRWSLEFTLDARLINFRVVIFPHWWDRLRWNMVAVSRTMIHPSNSVLAMMAMNWKHHLEIQHLNCFGCVVLAQQGYFLFQRMEFLLPSQFAEECSHHLIIPFPSPEKCVR